MSYIFYRADERPPSELQGGFKAWSPINVDDARKLVHKGDVDLVRQIIHTGRSQTTVHISTGLSDECGGYEHRGYIYKIEYDWPLYMIKVKSLKGTKLEDIKTFENLDLEVNAQVSPYLVIDHTNLKDATTIGLLSNIELSFLTSIPYGNIKQFKHGSGAWTDMP